ncbi:zinc ribbon domain-containing protein [Azohydromonas lata]|uniref:Zinc ribbon domain-containing protein n=1 Tax=Azohydromonas lata TaxID=45677 RepID=A0ABU5IPI5_9BURK|nr:zinc ribbon domain-containing protein [Azohydromonas lata]MDZ5460804.1 zinc ribbon domain-containing protein [Azohydromonas lata]
MSYDYSSANATLELPNPYRLQNRLLFACAALMCLAGLWTLFHSRLALGPVGVAVGLALLAAGVVTAATGAKRLRFFFGRGRPESLAPNLEPTVVGTSEGAAHLKRILRDGALTYPEPSRALEGLLYHGVPRLITAPLALQEQAKVAFYNLCALLVTALSFAVAWGVFGTEATRPLLSVAYFVFGAVFLLRPVVTASTARLTTASVVALLAAAVIGPALVGLLARTLPNLPQWSLAPQTAMLLVSGLVAVGLILAATLQQVQPPPPTQTSVQQSRVSLNVPPSLLLDELQRHLQEQWVERIPNRCYSRIRPVIDPQLHAGPFAGELMEETQPMPLAHMLPAGIAQALRSRRHAFLMLLDLYAALLMVVAVGCALAFVLSVEEGEGLSLRLLGASSIFIVVAAFCFRSSSRLWGRFDFGSVLSWVEMEGTYQTASLGTGNTLTGKVQSANQIVRTESMTLRVWRARIESVVFGKDSARQVTAMFSTDAEAAALAEHLIQFGQTRASLVAPGSPEDLHRIQALANAERALQGGIASTSQDRIAGDVAAALGATDAAAQAPGAVAPPQPVKPRYCPACGHKNPGHARFCMECGKSLEG